MRPSPFPCRGGRTQILAKLNGHKHLIFGDNDPQTTASKGWTSVQHYADSEKAATT